MSRQMDLPGGCFVCRGSCRGSFGYILGRNADNSLRELTKVQVSAKRNGAKRLERRKSYDLMEQSDQTDLELSFSDRVLSHFRTAQLP